MSTEPRKIWLLISSSRQLTWPFQIARNLEDFNLSPAGYKKAKLFIEHSAYQALEQKLAVAVEALNDIAEFKLQSADRNYLLLQCDGYKLRAERALALINPDRGEK